MPKGKKIEILEKFGFKPTKNLLTAAAAALFVLAVGYLSYKSFNRADITTEKVKFDVERVTQPETVLDEEKQAEEKESIIDKIKRLTKGGELESGTTSERQETKEAVAKEGETSWVANDYKQGQISKGSYTVIYGDTLWEIAEAVYGDGSLWVNILDANLANIGFLPNGEHALIFAGQTLVLP